MFYKHRKENSMTDEQFNKVLKIQGELHTLEKLDKSMNGCSPSSGFSMKCKTGYSEMGRDIERSIEMDGDTALECWCAMHEVIRTRLKEMRKRFIEIKIEGV